MKKFFDHVKNYRINVSILLFFIVSMIWFWGTQFVWISPIVTSISFYVYFRRVDRIKDFLSNLMILSVPALLSTIYQFWFTEIFGWVLWYWLMGLIVLGLLVWLFVVTYQASVRREDMREEQKEKEIQKSKEREVKEEIEREEKARERRLLNDYFNLRKEIIDNEENPDFKKILTLIRMRGGIDKIHMIEIPEKILTKAKLTDLVSSVCLVKKQIVFSSSDMQLALDRLSFLASNSFEDSILGAIGDRLIEIKNFHPTLKGHSVIMEMISKDEHLSMLLEYFETKN